jgi:hypothetical protein
VPLKITHLKEEEAPRPSASGRVNEDLIVLMDAMSNLSPGMVIEIEGDGRNVRSAKMLVSRAAKQLGTPWQHWNVGATVYAKPTEVSKRRSRRSRAD